MLFYLYFSLDGSEYCYNFLENALGTLIVQTRSNNFSIDIHGITYNLLTSSEGLTTNVKCPIGSVPTDINCGKILLPTLITHYIPRTVLIFKNLLEHMNLLI